MLPCVLLPAGQSSPLSPFFKEIITVLLSTAQRHDPSQLESTRLQIGAFEAINDMVRAASPDTLDIVGQLTPVFLGEIVKTFGMAVQSGEQREKQAELQGQLCGVLQVCCAAGTWHSGGDRQLCSLHGISPSLPSPPSPLTCRQVQCLSYLAVA